MGGGYRCAHRRAKRNRRILIGLHAPSRGDVRCAGDRGTYSARCRCGVDALFTPDWAALTDSSVWVAAYGQIFFSLSVAFGIMLTYSSYLKKDEDLTGPGLLVGFSNSSFEILAGIGVFASLGFMAQSTGQPINEVAGGGIGLAFIAFPTIINQAPAGVFIGVLFFGSLRRVHLDDFDH